MHRGKIASGVRKGKADLDEFGVLNVVPEKLVVGILGTDVEGKILPLDGVARKLGVLSW